LEGEEKEAEVRGRRSKRADVAAALLPFKNIFLRGGQ
jgi:hypothetical protein